MPAYSGQAPQRASTPSLYFRRCPSGRRRGSPACGGSEPGRRRQSSQTRCRCAGGCSGNRWRWSEKTSARRRPWSSFRADIAEPGHSIGKRETVTAAGSAPLYGMSENSSLFNTVPVRTPNEADDPRVPIQNDGEDSQDVLTKNAHLQGFEGRNGGIGGRNRNRSWVVA